MLSLDPIETKRLVLRPFDEDDLDVVARINADPEVRRFTGGVRSREDSDRAFLQRIREVRETGLGPRAVVERATAELIGWCGLQRFASTPEIEVFYGYARHVWGRGIAFEAASALIERGFTELAPSRLVAIVDPENVGSVRVLEKLGFERDGTWFHERWQREHDFFVRAAPTGSRATLRRP